MIENIKHHQIELLGIIHKAENLRLKHYHLNPSFMKKHPHRERTVQYFLDRTEKGFDNYLSCSKRRNNAN
jgi:hypothetical protein